MHLANILAQREERWLARRRMAERHSGGALAQGRVVSVLTLTLNIPGADKNLPGAAAALTLLQKRLRDALAASAACIVEEQQGQGADGPHWLAAVDMDALRLKALCVTLEEEHVLGRLADMDVMDAEGQPVNRAHIGCAPRRCFVCAAPAALCRREQRHSREELLRYVEALLRLTTASEEGCHV